jgi:hypothetical protein
VILNSGGERKWNYHGVRPSSNPVRKARGFRSARRAKSATSRRQSNPHARAIRVRSDNLAPAGTYAKGTDQPHFGGVGRPVSFAPPFTSRHVDADKRKEI